MFIWIFLFIIVNFLAKVYFDWKIFDRARPIMSRGPFVAGANRRFLVPSLSQEISDDESEDSSDESDSSESEAEHSSPTQTTVSSSFSASSPPSSSSTSAAARTAAATTASGETSATNVTTPEKNLLYKAETYQVNCQMYFHCHTIDNTKLFALIFYVYRGFGLNPWEK